MRRVVAFGMALSTAVACGGEGGPNPGDLYGNTASGDSSLHKPRGTGGSGGSAGQGPECRTVAQCAVPQICKQCPDGSASCAQGACVNGQCETTFPDCPAGAGGASGTPQCAADADCPAIGAPCRVCSDGTTACPSDRCINGTCVASFPSCPPGTGGTGSGGSSGVECRSAGDCLVPQICKQCPDGTASCAKAECDNGKCATIFPPCPAGTGGSGGMGAGGSGGGGMHWFLTCGDPICRVPPPNDPTTMPTCDPTKGEKAGAPCTEANLECDPGAGCGQKLVCTTSDPKHGGACPVSRAKYKEGIEYVSSAERAKLADELQSIPLVRYRYKDAPEREHLGFIIEDVEPSASVDSKRDQVDLYGYASLAVAALQQQHAQIEELRREVRALKARLQHR